MRRTWVVPLVLLMGCAGRGADVRKVTGGPADPGAVVAPLPEASRTLAVEEGVTTEPVEPAKPASGGGGGHEHVH